MATIASLLRERVTLQVNCVDRIFLAGYLPKLQSEGMLVRFCWIVGFRFPVRAALGKIGAAYVRAIERFAGKYRIPVVHFKKGQSKELVARRYMHQAERNGRFGVVMIGVAQEKASAWRGFKAGGSASHPHFCDRRRSVFPNHLYFCIRDREWGPAFIKARMAGRKWPSVSRSRLRPSRGSSEARTRSGGCSMHRAIARYRRARARPKASTEGRERRRLCLWRVRSGRRSVDLEHRGQAANGARRPRHPESRGRRALWRPQDPQ